MNVDDLARRIRAAAASVFAERGFAATTVNEIVQRADVSKPALYRVYPSKSHLYSALIENHAQEMADAALGAFSRSTGNIEDRLLAMISAWFEHAVKNPDLFRLLHRDVPTDDLVAAAAQRIHEMQVANDVMLIRSYAPGLPEAEIEPIGEVLRSALVVLGTWAIDHPEQPSTVAVDAMLRVCRGILLSTTATTATTARTATTATANTTQSR
jgi:AcrR family transcriptional regulator